MCNGSVPAQCLMNVIGMQSEWKPTTKFIYEQSASQWVRRLLRCLFAALEAHGAMHIGD